MVAPRRSGEFLARVRLDVFLLLTTVLALGVGFAWSVSPLGLGFAGPANPERRYLVAAAYAASYYGGLPVLAAGQVAGIALGAAGHRRGAYAVPLGAMALFATGAAATIALVG